MKRFFVNHLIVAALALSAAFTSCDDKNDEDDKEKTVAVTGVSLDQTTLTFTVGDVPKTLTATVAPADATNDAVKWSIDPAGVATVVNGVVTPAAPGTATITVTTTDGDKTATCTVYVNAATVAVTGVTLEQAAITLEIGETETLAPTVAPANATDNTVTWTSDNPDVATVVDGVVTAVAEGAATITVTTTDGGKTATCAVTVNSDDPDAPPKKGDVFVAGSSGGQAILWKNGVAQVLSDPNLTETESYNLREYARSVFVSGSDVYVAGYQNRYNTNKDIAVLYKNGVAQYLTDGTNNARAHSVFVSGNNVYVAGYEHEGGGSSFGSSRARLWKNGEPQTLSLSTFLGSVAHYVCVSGNDVYVIGVNLQKIVVWTNGERQDIVSLPMLAEESCGYVYGSDVYVSGRPGASGSFLSIWKNGVAQELTDVNAAGSSSVFVSGSGVYVSGYERNAQNIDVATVWKNGIAQHLTDGTNRAVAYSVFASGSDVYVAGFENVVLGSVAKLWKNGVAQDLTDGTQYAVAYSVFVVE